MKAKGKGGGGTLPVEAQLPINPQNSVTEGNSPSMPDTSPMRKGQKLLVRGSQY